MEIIKRCFYCNPKHLMDDNGDRIIGEIIKGVAYSDGICNVAMPKAQEETRIFIEKNRVKTLCDKLMRGEI